MYSYDRTASSKFNPATVRSIARMTDQNEVPKALAAGAKMLGLTEMEKKFGLIGQLQKLEGHLPSGLKEYRESLYDALMDAAKQELSEDEYQKFYGAY